MVDKMDIEVLTDKKLELEIVLHGEKHALCNALRKILMEDDDVQYAVYGIDHPLIREPIMTIKTKQKKVARNSLKKAAETLKDQAEEFKSLVEQI